MRVIVVDGCGLIGTKVVAAIRKRRHEALLASSDVGVNVETGEGLFEVLAGAEVVIDLTHPLSAVELIEGCCLKLIAAASAAHVRHHVALSEVGTDRLLDSAYFRAQRARERLIEESLVPHTILRSTQFFEYMDRMDGYRIEGRAVRVPPICVQPVLSDEVAAALADLAVSLPRNTILEMAGPQRLRLDEVVRRLFCVRQNMREVTTDAQARYFGAQASDEDLLPDEEAAIIGETRFEEWLSQSRQ